jgi:PhzF family phenazine biosynthesis protein
MIPEMYQVDAFTSERFSGNPAAICVIDGHEFPDAQLMQAVALEMNLSETAFITAPEGGVRPLRWFTPTVEVELCGHATLATSHVLWERFDERADTVTFSTRSGLLAATRGVDGTISMDFPADRPHPVEPPDALLGALGCEVREIAAGSGYVIARLASAAAVVAVEPNMALLARLGPRGVIITAEGDGTGREDFVSRVFVPSAGVPEDPVTGSAHCALAPFWAERLGRATLTAHQVSARGGWLEVTDRGDRVVLAGKAVTTARIAMI